MAGVARYAKATAKPGQGQVLADKMLEVAAALRDVPGCELYVINRSIDDPDVVWVTEQWASQEQLEAALQTEGARAAIPEVLELIAEGGFERIDLEPLGGHGYPAGQRGFSVARFARGPLGATATGLSLQRLRPGARQSFGHHHRLDEEIYVVLKGSGQIAVDDEVRDIRPLDAIRVAPASVRAFQAGPDGLAFLAMGTHHAGDPQMDPGYWPES
jgi:quinol monooxygenase YgiN/quercetin dioxygenase-like cupin family protein